MPDPLLFGCSIYVPFLPTEMLTDMECAFIVEKKQLFWLTLQLRPGRKCHSLHQGLELVRDAEIQLQIIFCRNLPTYSTFVAIQKHAFS